MTPEQLQDLLDNIFEEVNAVTTYASGVAPQLLPAVVIGRALQKVVPGIAADIDRMIQGNPPTDLEKANMRAKLSVLGNPDLP